MVPARTDLPFTAESRGGKAVEVLGLDCGGQRAVRPQQPVMTSSDAQHTMETPVTDRIVAEQNRLPGRSPTGLKQSCPYTFSQLSLTEPHNVFYRCTKHPSIRRDIS